MHRSVVTRRQLLRVGLSLAALPRLDDLGGEREAIKERLLQVAEARAS